MPEKRRPLSSLISTAVLLATGLVTRASFADHYRVPSGSMEPTVHVGDHIVVEKAAYGLRIPMTDRWLLRYGAPARGDVVVLEPPKGDELEARSSDPLGTVLLKRVVALPGELVEVRSGHVRIDGRPLTEPTISLDFGGGPDFGPVRVPRGKLLVLGDNRGNSRDGRSFGWIEVDKVIGRAAAVVARDGRLRYLPL